MGVFSSKLSKANTAQPGAKHARDGSPSQAALAIRPQKIDWDDKQRTVEVKKRLSADERARQKLVLQTERALASSRNQPLTRAAEALRRWHRQDDGVDPFAPPVDGVRPLRAQVLELLKGMTRERLSALKVAQLKEICRCAGTPMSGTKAQLVGYLLDPAANQSRRGSGPLKYDAIDSHAPPAKRHRAVSPGRALPAGWELRVDAKTSREFFVDHNARRTAWRNPLEFPPTLDDRF
jgi:hypothetical protein